MYCGPPLISMEPAELPECGDPAPDLLEQRDAEPSIHSGTQLPPGDPPANIPTWLFLPERRLEADPLRVRPADVRSARALYKGTLLLKD